MIVTGGGSMRRGGFLQDVEADLKEAGFEVEIFEGVESDPSVETVMKAPRPWSLPARLDYRIGGGSPIDAAKAMWLFYEYPEETFEQAVVPFSFPELRTKAKFCAIASTSGTATEVTAFSVITDYEKASSTRWPTSTSRPMSPSSTPSSPTPCRPSSVPTPAWTR